MSDRPTNHLRDQTSPYLLQHVHNPVDWYPWGAEALEKARQEDRPIFLSIGYAACHWCHVMERESFEDERVAAALNRHFVSIKVDREERPDIDGIYMNAVQILTGAGGWPLTAFLTPDLRPFFAGTYFPPEDRHGRIGLLALLERVREAWARDRAGIERSARGITEHLQELAAGESGPADGVGVGETERRLAAATLAGRFEPRYGGFGGAPKFPPDGALTLLLREHQRSGEAVPLNMVLSTLDGMALGGLFDHIGGGFARYSVDEFWLVPHFEKMLYNQALLVPIYTDAWRLTERPLYRQVVLRTLDFVARELTAREGGFWSSLDADSEGEEGRYYVWTAAEVEAVLGTADAQFFGEFYGITPEGNFEGRNIPNLLDGTIESQAVARAIEPGESERRLAACRERLLLERARRVRPATDDKVLTAWNGLMITALCSAYRAFGRPQDLGAAATAADFIADRLLLDGRLRASWRDGRAHLNGYLDDYAFFARGLVDLYEAGFDVKWLRLAEQLARTMRTHFEDEVLGGFWFVSDDHERLLTRPRSGHDDALPSGAAVAVELLQRLGVHLDDDAFRSAAERTLRASAPMLARMPSAWCWMLAAADRVAGPAVEVAVVGGDRAAREALLHEVGRRYLPRLALAASAEPAPEGEGALLAGREALGGEATAYVCRDYTCREPVTRPTALRELLDALA